MNTFFIFFIKFPVYFSKNYVSYILKKQLIECDTATVLNEIGLCLQGLVYTNSEEKEVIDFEDIIDTLNLYINEFGGRRININ